MTKAEYRVLFTSALQQALQNAELELGYAIPKDIYINLVGGGHSGDLVDFDEALNSIYLGDSLSFFVIDVAVQSVSPKFSVLFVRVSGHTPVGYEHTWTSTDGQKIFKQALAQIKFIDE